MDAKAARAAVLRAQMHARTHGDGDDDDGSSGVPAGGALF